MKNTANALTSIITANDEAIREEIKKSYRRILNNQGRTCYSIYIWDDGEIETLEQLGYPSGWLQPKEWEIRELYFLTNIKYDIEGVYEGWNYEDDDEREQANQEAEAWFEENELDSIMNQIYEDAESFDEDGYTAHR